MPYSRHEKPPGVVRDVFNEQLRWLIRLRWLACIGIVAAGLASTRLSVLATAAPIYICTALLFVLNVVYYLAILKKSSEGGYRPLVLGMVQVEMEQQVPSCCSTYSISYWQPLSCLTNYRSVSAYPPSPCSA
jgi:hypothetical protein